MWAYRAQSSDQLARRREFPTFSLHLIHGVKKGVILQGKEKRGPAKIVYADDTEIRG